jgi:hypothetical protein
MGWRSERHQIMRLPNGLSNSGGNSVPDGPPLLCGGVVVDCAAKGVGSEVVVMVDLVVVRVP